MDVQLGTLGRVDGSCEVRFGEYSVVVSANGPGEVRLKSELPDRATFEVVWKPWKGGNSCREKGLAAYLRQVLEPLILVESIPRSLLTVVVQETSEQTCMAVAINAAVLALADAGVPLSDLAYSVECCIGKDKGLYISPSHSARSSATSTHTFTFDQAHKQALSVCSSGVFDLQTVYL